MTKVLYIEDDILTGQICSKMFEMIPNTSLKVCTSGYEAIEHLKSHQYDLILLDLSLPDISGLKIADCLRSQHELTIPMVLTSAHIDSDMSSSLVDQVVEKPMTIAKLKEILTRHTNYSS